MGAHTAQRATVAQGVLSHRTMLTGAATVALLAAGAGSALANEGHDHGRSIDGDFNNTCSSEAGDIHNPVRGEGALGVGQVAGPVGSGSNVNVLNCTNILNDFLNDNDVSIALLGDAGIGDIPIVNGP